MALNSTRYTPKIPTNHFRSGLLVFSEFEYSGQSDFWWRTLNRMFVGEQTVADYPYYYSGVVCWYFRSLNTLANQNFGGAHYIVCLLWNKRQLTTPSKFIVPVADLTSIKIGVPRCHTVGRGQFYQFLVTTSHIHSMILLTSMIPACWFYTAHMGKKGSKFRSPTELSETTL
jgi:hypothetical protein